MKRKGPIQCPLPTATRTERAFSSRIERVYIDASGHRRYASPGAIGRVLHILQADRACDNSSADISLAALCVEPVVAAWDSKPFRVAFRAPDTVSGAISLRVRFEGGESKPLRPISTKTKPLSTVQIPGLPFGYHELVITTAKAEVSALIISAPSRVFTPAEPVKRWGLFLPLYAAHSDSGWGSGTFSDYARLSQWAGGLGATLMGTLPILPNFLTGPRCDPSPYTALSRLFWNEFYLDIERIPELARCKNAQRLLNSPRLRKHLARWRIDPVIDFRKQMAIKREVLTELCRSFFATFSTRRDAFDRFCRSRPDLETYARFRATCDSTEKPWRDWPARMREGQLHPGDYADADRQYHLFAQWLADLQANEMIAKARAAGVDLYFDLPVGVHPDGYDAWKEREIFLSEASVGAPPDLFYTAGQNWGFAPMHPEKLRQQHYRYVIDYLRFQMQHARLLRIDHVMGLHRLYCIPDGCPASEGVYIRYAADELYAILSLESHRHGTILIGENLGTVPPETNASMRRHRLYQMYVMQFQQQPDAKKPLTKPEPRVVASFNTHDLPTFLAHWRGSDVADRLRLRLIGRQDALRERALRRRLRAALIIYFRRRRYIAAAKPSPSDVLDACLKWLSSSAAEIVLINLEDLWLEPRQQNMPGTTTQHPNWRRKTRYPLEKISTQAKVAERLRMVAHYRKASR